MPDVLIRDVPADDLARIDGQARRVGLSRTEYLRRQLSREARRPERDVTVADLQSLSAALTDLADAAVMRDAGS